MSDRTGIFAGEDPFSLAQSWMESAAASEPNDANAMSLATVDETGMPNVRIVLLKEIEPDAFVFYTNYESAKARELEYQKKAAFVLHWKTTGRQVRGRGLIERIEADKSNAYYASRPLDSRIGAWASQQSRELSSRAQLEVDVEKAKEKYGQSPERPEHWGGYRIVPTELEFWANGAFRLHDRFQWTRPDIAAPWKIHRLYP